MKIILLPFYIIALFVVFAYGLFLFFCIYPILTVYKIIRYKNEEAKGIAELTSEIRNHPIIKTIHIQLVNNCIQIFTLNNFIVPTDFIEVNHVSISKKVDDHLKTFLIESALKEHEFKDCVDAILTTVRGTEFFNIYTGTLRFKDQRLEFDQSLSLKDKLQQVFNHLSDQAYYLPRKFLKHLIKYMEQNTQ